MRSPLFLLIIGLIMLFYALLNYYVGLRGWQFLGRYIPFLSSKAYWLVFWLIAMSYFLGRLGGAFLPGSFVQGLKVIGSYWLAALFYMILIWAAVDVLRLLDRLVDFSARLQIGGLPQAAVGGLVFMAVLGIMVYGSWNARNPQIVEYQINIPKKAGNYDTLSAVLVSDIHLGSIVDNRRLNEMIDMINQLEPELVLLAGDIIDEDVEFFVEQQMAESFRRLTPKLGTYAVLGNHEYIGGNAEDAVHYLQEAGIHVLIDDYVLVEDSFYIVGRDDRAGTRFTGQGRKSLTDIMQGVDNGRPIILLDHQPTHLEEAREAGVDLQLSGHTHRGQLFPNHLITQKIFEIDWGYLLKGDLQVIVSTGYGTWGPPIRIGNKPELVYIKFQFGP
ncbi:MAG: metallophosphoesterase [Bacillota bacterium]